jgi:NAD(P)H-nitrite reductase large subunit
VRLLIIGGSDAGISAGLAAKQVDPAAEVTLLVADTYPNFSICGIPYHVSGEVPDWRDLAHRSHSDLERAGLTLRLEHRATAIDPDAQTVTATGPQGATTTLAYDRLIVGTGAIPARPPIHGLDRLGPPNGVHVLHTIGDTFDLLRTLDNRQATSAVIVGDSLTDAHRRGTMARAQHCATCEAGADHASHVRRQGSGFEPDRVAQRVPDGSRELGGPGLGRDRPGRACCDGPP